MAQFIGFGRTGAATAPGKPGRRLYNGGSLRAPAAEAVLTSGPDMHLHQGFAAAIDALLDAAIDAGDAPGAVVAVTDRQGVIYQAARGVASQSGPRPMRTDSVVWIASMTKALVSAAALQLVERGQVGLDEPLAARVPALGDAGVLTGFDPAGQPITRAPATPVTLQHLLTHTAGFGYEYWSAQVQQVHRAQSLPGIATCRAAALRAPLLFDPGTRWEYGIGTDWLGRVIEALSGRSLGRYLRDELLGPLGMHDTAFRLDARLQERLASVHRRNADGSWRATNVLVPQEPEFEMGGGGLYGTAADYLAFVRMILNRGRGPGGAVLTPDSVAAMMRNQTGDLTIRALASVQPGAAGDLDFFPGLPKHFGYGFLLTAAPAPSGLPAASLLWAGLANTYFWIDPGNGIGAVVLSQLLPFADPRALGLFLRVQAAMYGA